jgi:hypothetical protein
MSFIETFLLFLLSSSYQIETCNTHLTWLGDVLTLLSDMLPLMGAYYTRRKTLIGH